MALPELLLPAGTPPFLAEGHAVELLPVYADTAMRTGHARRRRIFTTSPRLVSVSLRLTPAQAAAFDAWFEGPLRVGTRPFTAIVANQGPGVRYWEATFEAPYEAEALPGGRWRVTAQLRLTGEGSATPPVPTSLVAATLVPMVGAAVITIPQRLVADSAVALIAVAASMHADSSIELSSTVNGAPATDADFEIRWSWLRLPSSPGADYAVEGSEEASARNWLGF